MSKVVDNKATELEKAVNSFEVPKEVKDAMGKYILNVIQLEKAEQGFDLKSKSLLELYKTMFDLMSGSFNKLVKAHAVRLKLEVLVSDSGASASVQQRVKKSLATFEQYYTSGLTIKVMDIPFTLTQRVLNNRDTINKSQLKKAGALEGEEYKQRVTDLCTEAEYNKLAGDIDTSIIPDEVEATLSGMNEKQLKEVMKFIRLTIHNK